MAFERSVGHIAQLTSLESLRVRWMLVGWPESGMHAREARA